MPYTDPEKQAESRRKSSAKWKKNHPVENAKHKENWRRKTGSAAGKGHGGRRPWTQEEDRQVLAHSIPDRELAAKIGRTVMAIQVRRNRIRQTPGPCGPCSGPGVLECEHTQGRMSDG